MAAVWLDLLALMIYGPLIVLLHELGHAAFARRGGFRVTDFAIGFGRPLKRIRIGGGAVVHIDRWFFAGGSCTAIPIGPVRARRAWFHLGGLIAQTALLLALLPFAHIELVSHALLFNGLVMVHNALPWRVGSFASDGWYALDALTGRGRGGDVLSQQPAIERMAERAEQVESPMGIAYSRVCLAWADVIAGRPERADPLFRDDPPETALEPWVDVLYHYVKAEWDRAGGRGLGALRTAREAHLEVDLTRVPDGGALIALAEARALADLDAPGQSQRALSRVAGVGGPIGWQASATLIWASLDGEPDALELATTALLSRLLEPGLDPTDGALALWQASAVLDEAGRIEASRSARRGAHELARTVLGRAPVEARATLVRRLGPVAGVGPRNAAATGR